MGVGAAIEMVISVIEVVPTPFEVLGNFHAAAHGALRRTVSDRIDSAYQIVGEDELVGRGAVFQGLLEPVVLNCSESQGPSPERQQSCPLPV